jgi:hypothetical protein
VSKKKFWRGGFCRSIPWLITLVAIALCCQTNQQAGRKQEFDYARRLGVAIINAGNRAGLDIKNPLLAVGNRIHLVSLAKPQATAEAEVLGKLEKTFSDTDINNPQESHYEIKLVDDGLPALTLAFAIANFSGPFESKGDLIQADLDGDGQPESFQYCMSSEGVHLTVWSGQPLTGKRRWHRYYYLGYDVEADCTEIETNSQEGTQ